MKLHRRWIAALAALAVFLGGSALAAEGGNVLMRETYVKEYLKEAQRDFMEAAEGPTGVLGNDDVSRLSVRSVTFLDSTRRAPEDAWDVSAAGDASVLAWVEDRGEDGALLVDFHGHTAGDADAPMHATDLYIAAKGGVRANPDSSFLFMGYINLQEIDFNDSFSTEGAQRMTGMFDECASLERLDLSDFDTAQVTDMSGMFARCESLTELNLGSFDTAQVTDMSGMFTRCESLEALNLNSFDTGNVADMRAMFARCLRLQGLDWSERFVIRKGTKVQDMLSMTPLGGG